MLATTALLGTLPPLLLIIFLWRGWSSPPRMSPSASVRFGGCYETRTPVSVHVVHVCLSVCLRPTLFVYVVENAAATPEIIRYHSRCLAVVHMPSKFHTDTC